MSKYLNAFLSSLSGGQKDAIIQLLERDKSSGAISTKEQFDVELAQLAKQLVAGRGFESNLDLVYPEGLRISSDMFNENFKAFWVALHGLFHQLNKADVTVNRHREVRNSDFTKLKAAVNKLVEDISIYRFLRFTQEGWSEVRFSDFTNRRNKNTTIKAAEVDDQTKNLRLRIGRSRRVNDLRGSRPTKVSVEALGSAQADTASKSFEPGNILDNKLDTFWAHLILADEPLQTVVDGSTYTGAMVHVTVEFPNVEQMSYLKLLPFGSHPVEVLKIEYWTGTAWAEMTGWTAVDATLDWQEFGFEEVQTGKIRVLLRQQSYTRNTYLIPRRLFTVSLLWEMVLDQQLMLGVEEEQLTDAQQISVNTNPRFRALIAALKKWDDRMDESGINMDTDTANELMRTIDAATAVMASTRESDAGIITRQLDGTTDAPELRDDDMVEITKLEYLMGLYHMDIEHRDYYPVGVFESIEYENTGVPYEVGIDVDESHVTHDDSGTVFNRTSIEYRIDIAPERSYPIRPTGQLNVPQELLWVDADTQVAKTRFDFAILTGMTLRCNGKAITTFTPTNPNVLTIDSGYKRNAIYTLDYAAATGSDLFDIDATFNSIPLDKPQVFSQTDDNGMLDLGFYPYLAWEIINDDENWAKPDPDHARYLYRVENGDITVDNIDYGPAGLKIYEPISVKVDGILAQNLTDYRSKIQPAFVETQEELLVYQYIHVGSKLYFCRPITGATIEVNYRWIAQYLRLTATLRGHQPAMNPYTPLLKNFRMKSRTSRL